MKFYGRSEEVAGRIIEQFEKGDIPKALSQIFVNRADHIPSGSWSWRNRFLQAIHGTSDSRGFKQWKKAGRSVSKGSKAIYILGPCMVKDKDDAGEEQTKLIGFKSIAVFPIECTEVTDEALWAKCSGIDNQEEARLKDLPLIEVAEQWALKVKSFNGKQAGALGYYRHGEVIALGVENLSTWTHELCHAADDKLGTLVKAGGQVPSNEVVAEFGGAVVLTLMGKEVEADLGGAWNYIKGYSKDDTNKALKACSDLIGRICSCVDLIITTAEELQEARDLDRKAA